MNPAVRHADPRLADPYPEWDVRPVDAAKSMVDSGKRDEKGATKAPEILIVNGPRSVEQDVEFSLSAV